jgi:hypothetical protein
VANLTTIHLTMTGTAPLICHNGQTADPRNYYSKKMKEISSKRKKTDADYEQMAKIEWLAGVYVSKRRFILPSHVVEAAVLAGAKKSRNGPQAKSGLYFTEDAVLSFHGMPEGEITLPVLEEMFDSDEFTLTAGVKVGMSKVMRTRPIFRGWQASIKFDADKDVLNAEDLLPILQDTGGLVGIGDWRPKYGRFNVELA